MPDKEKMGRIAAIKNFFEKDGGRKVEVSEFKKLSPEDRQELAELAAIELNVDLT